MRENSNGGNRRGKLSVFELKLLSFAISKKGIIKSKIPKIKQITSKI